jgi:hypothetical protein
MVEGKFFRYLNKDGYLSWFRLKSVGTVKHTNQNLGLYIVLENGEAICILKANRDDYDNFLAWMTRKEK